MNPKAAARERFESGRGALIDLSHRIHAHPELGFEEERASSWLCESLADAGFNVEKGICDLPTAFRAMGRPFPDLGELTTRPTGSTDMGNVSLAIPSIHPMTGINSLPAVNHQPEFAAHCVTRDADKALADGALAMAWTCIDLATDREAREVLLGRA
jgi:metal-dependent amidase/aminoacylase/carboxypeptidase family protein